jgi:uncharacterized protein YxeA
MKKVLAVILAVIMLTSIAGTVYAENPTDNPFAVQPTVTKFLSIDKFFFESSLRASSIYEGPDNTMWIVFWKVDSKTYHLIQLDDTGKILKDVDLKVSYESKIIKGNYYYITVLYKDINNKDSYSLYCFDFNKGDFVWKKDFVDSYIDYFTLTPNGIMYNVHSNSDKTNYQLEYTSDEGKTIFTTTNANGFAINSKNNSLFAFKEIDGEKHIVEFSLSDGTIVKTYEPLSFEQNSDKLTIGYVLDNLLDFANTDTFLATFNSSNKTSEYYTDKFLLAKVRFDGSKFIIEDTAIYTPNRSDGFFDQLYQVYPANFAFNYVLKDINGYRIFMDSAFYHLLKQNIEVHDLNNNLLWSKTTYSTKTIWNFNAPVTYKDMIVYGDSGKIVFANLSDGKVRYSLPVDEIGGITNVAPMGSKGNSFFYALTGITIGNATTSIYKVTFPGTITINSNIPSAGFTITSGDKSMKWTVGKSLDLPNGTYTITMDAPAIDGIKTPDPVQVTVEDGIDKSIEIDYVDTKAPDLTIDNPVVNGITATINGTVTDNLSGVKEVSINGTAVTISDGKFTTNLPITNGILSFTISATDNAGNTTSKSFKYDYLSPEVSFTVSNPTIYRATNTATFIVNGNATDNDAIDTVTVNNTIVPVINGKFSITLNTTYSPGSDYTITIIATDKSGNKTTKTYNYTFKNTTEIVLKINDKNFTVNGETRTLDAPPIIKNGRTLLPIRPVVEALGGTVGWDGTEKKVTVSLGSTTIELWIGKNTARVNGTDTPIDSTNSKVVPEIINGRTMLPLRFVTENLGCQLQWDPNTKTITITYQG